MENDYTPLSAEAEEFQLEVSIVSDSTLAEIPQPLERPYQLAVLALEPDESDPLSSGLVEAEPLSTTPSLTQWDPIERPFKPRSSTLFRLEPLPRQTLEGKPAEGQRDELSGISNNHLLLSIEDDLIAPVQVSLNPYDMGDRSYRFYIEQVDLGDVTTLNLNPIHDTYTLGSFDPLSTDSSTSQRLSKFPEIYGGNEPRGGEDFYFHP